jgi:Ca-activated chloride channel homolog
MSSTLLTIAKDVKIQIEFNPAQVAEYRLIGYDNRQLQREDFNNDKIDAGEIGAGHTVTAIYEITPIGSSDKSVDPLRYQTKAQTQTRFGNELGFLRLRYKAPNADVSQLMETPLVFSAVTASPRLKFAASVVAFAEHLQGGSGGNNFSLRQVKSLAADVTGGAADKREFLALIDAAARIKTQ